MREFIEMGFPSVNLFVSTPARTADNINAGLREHGDPLPDAATAIKHCRPSLPAIQPASPR
ncbi:MAG: hypothetical protein ABJM58_03240 [Alteripontixanthobacter sp.]